MNTVIIDYEKLRAELKSRGKTNGWLSEELGRNADFISHIKQKPEQPKQTEKFICMVLGMEEGSFILSNKEVLSDDKAVLPTELGTLCKEVQKISGAIEGMCEELEKIWNKLNANTLQLARIGDCVKRFEKSDCENAMDFLKTALADGKMNGEEILMRSDAAGIKRAALMKAKNTIGVDTSVTGYGKNQKTWWFIPK